MLKNELVKFNRELLKKALSRFVWVSLFCSTPPESYCFIITNPALYAGLLKFDYSVVLELRLEFAREALATYNKLNRLKQ
jgi:hypothetical protein